MNGWQNKTIYITGAGSGIGLEIVKTALENGANVSAFYRSNNSAIQDLSSSNLLLTQGDVTNIEDLKNSIKSTLERFKKIDVIINNAGCMYYMDMTNPDYEQMLTMLNTNCLGFINLITIALPQLITQKQGHVINITSDAGKRPFAGLAIYSGSKAFVEFSANALRQELIEHNIKVTNIQPGNVKTPLHNHSTNTQALEKYASVDNGQYLDPKDIVASINFALSTPFNTAINEILIEPLSESI